MSVSITFPFIMVASDHHEFQDHLIFMEKIVDSTSLPAATSKLPQLDYVELGGYSDDGYYAVMYSPSQLGHSLFSPDHNTWEYCAPVLFDHLNQQYLKHTRVKNKAKHIPLANVPEDWFDHARDDNVDLQNLYERWESQKQHAAISAQLPHVTASKSRSKI